MKAFSGKTPEGLRCTNCDDDPVRDPIARK
jgi:hypothetical protein